MVITAKALETLTEDTDPVHRSFTRGQQTSILRIPAHYMKSKNIVYTLKFYSKNNFKLLGFKY